MIVLKGANNHDVTLISKLAKEIFPATYGEILNPEALNYLFEMMYAPHNILYQMEVDKHRYFIAYNGGEPCGYLSLARRGENHFHLEKIYILPSMQGKGIGREIIEFALGYVKEWNRGEPCLLELNVNRGNRAKEFYEHLGFVVAREIDEEVGNGIQKNDYIMALEL